MTRVASCLKFAPVENSITKKVQFKKPRQEPEGFMMHALQLHCHVRAASAGPYCNRTWDGWLCWGDTAPGTAMQMCPEYFIDFDPAGEALTHSQTRLSSFFFNFQASFLIHLITEFQRMFVQVNVMSSCCLQQRKSPKCVILMASGSITQRAIEVGQTTPSVRPTPMINSR